jgi:hypothetical protein
VIRFRPLLAPALLFVVGFLLFPVSGSDDKYITYWSAHSLATRGELVNYNGDRVEQASSLTHVVVLAAAAKVLPWSMPAIGWLVSVTAGLAAVVLTRRLAAVVDPALAGSAGWLAASSTSLVYWSFGGLDSTLAAVLTVALLLTGLRIIERGASLRRLAAASLVSLAYVGVRPEAVFVASAVWVAVLLPGHMGRRAVRRTLMMLALALLAFAVLTLFRYIYFGDIFPQPVRAKVGGPLGHTLKLGFQYVVLDPFRRWDPLPVTFAIAGAAMTLVKFARGRPRSWPIVLVALFCVAQLCFVFIAGGDWMEAGRFLVPAAPVAAVLGAFALSFIPSPRGRFWSVAAVVTCQVLASVQLARRDSFSGPAWAETARPAGAAGFQLSWFDLKNRLHAQLVPLAAELNDVLVRVHRADGQPVRVFSGQMGFVPYEIALKFFGHVRFIDKGGLTTREVTALPPSPRWQRGQTGLLLRYVDLFDLSSQPGAKAAWLPPDIIFDYDLRNGPDPNRESAAAAHGYTIVYRQSGFPPSGSATLPGHRTWRDAFIGIHEGLAAGSNPSLREFRFVR